MWCAVVRLAFRVGRCDAAGVCRSYQAPPRTPPFPLPPFYLYSTHANNNKKQAYGSETLYGSYFGAGDTVGVLLDMDRGTLSFVKARV